MLNRDSHKRTSATATARSTIAPLRTSKRLMPDPRLLYADGSKSKRRAQALREREQKRQELVQSQWQQLLQSSKNASGRVASDASSTSSASSATLANTPVHMTQATQGTKWSETMSVPSLSSSSSLSSLPSSCIRSSCFRGELGWSRQCVRLPTSHSAWTPRELECTASALDMHRDEWRRKIRHFGFVLVQNNASVVPWPSHTVGLFESFGVPELWFDMPVRIQDVYAVLHARHDWPHVALMWSACPLPRALQLQQRNPKLLDSKIGWTWHKRHQDVKQDPRVVEKPALVDFGHVGPVRPFGQSFPIRLLVDSDRGIVQTPWHWVVDPISRMHSDPRFFALRWFYGDSRDWTIERVTDPNQPQQQHTSRASHAATTTMAATDTSTSMTSPQEEWQRITMLMQMEPTTPGRPDDPTLAEGTDGSEPHAEGTNSGSTTNTAYTAHTAHGEEAVHRGHRGHRGHRASGGLFDLLETS